MTDVVTVEVPSIVSIGQQEQIVSVVSGQTVSVVTQGQQGPPGVSIGSAVYEHIQSVPLASWTINHNLGFRPNVSVKSIGGLEVDAEVLHVSVTQVQIFFDLPATGIVNFS